ncbi:MAG: alpha/beta hydrolase domain-containing protein [Bacteroidota bacterium]|nr:alpha/beta hydrolase domain-containing protein [Bacteroidota bacterium]
MNLLPAIRSFSARQFKQLVVILIVLSASYQAQSRIVTFYIARTEPYLNGKTFGNAGSYVRITGKIYGEIDPGNPLNGIIQDIQLAPGNEKGFVEYVSDYVILRPADMSKSNGILFLSLPNRGNMFPPDTALLTRGYVWAWCAWQGDVLEGNNRLTMKVPYASNKGEEIAGILRTEYQVTAPVKTLNLSSGFFTGLTHHSYETIDTDNIHVILTKRIHESDERVPVPASEWAFSDCSEFHFPGIPSFTKISMKDGFDPDYIYELIYTAKNPLVLGLGFAAIRDFASFLKYEIKDDPGRMNPLLGEGETKSPVKAAIMQGISQCSNFARTFLLLGFNQDEKGHKVFDGINAHAGTRRISLNIRFGRPGGGGLQREDHLFPGNDPPFTWSTEADPVSGITGGILEKCLATGTCPKIMQTLSSTEYWQLRASLTTTDSYGIKDLTIPDNVRIYLFSGTQHSPASVPDQLSGFAQNPNSYYPYLRALLVALEKWILEGKAPPASAYPTIETGTLAATDKSSTGWPDIPGVPYNGKANILPFLDYGLQYDFRNLTGILSQEPPKVKSDQPYITLVPKVDRDGNEIAGIRGIDIRVPLGTHTGWALRREGYGSGDLSSLSGMFIPFKKTRKERIEAKDPRLSLQERYKSHENYLEAVRKAAEELVNKGYLLPEDAEAEIHKAENSNILK